MATTATMASLCWDVACAASPYVAPARPRWPPQLARRVLSKSCGHCFHCAAVLPPDAHGRRQWDIDHHPVPYRDIADQQCCGVRDALDESNLVASCVACNRGGAHERAQACRCHRRYLVRAARLACAAVVAVVVAVLVLVARRVASGGAAPLWARAVVNTTTTTHALRTPPRAP